mmetsp:Transcript_344/g.949  ORF Transcript_344/g.949 Transcript_344/m.949 type:complete len:275 (-) Transcript_344:362-1186(-)
MICCHHQRGNAQGGGRQIDGVSYDPQDGVMVIITTGGDCGCCCCCSSCCCCCRRLTTIIIRRCCVENGLQNGTGVGSQQCSGDGLIVIIITFISTVVIPTFAVTVTVYFLLLLLSWSWLLPQVVLQGCVSNGSKQATPLRLHGAIVQGGEGHYTDIIVIIFIRHNIIWIGSIAVMSLWLWLLLLPPQCSSKQFRRGHGTRSRRTQHGGKRHNVGVLCGKDLTGPLGLRSTQLGQLAIEIASVRGGQGLTVPQESNGANSSGSSLLDKSPSQRIG